jgi:O-antigen/teichoic acid export membrane protein
MNQDDSIEPAGVFSDAYASANLKSLVLRGGAVKLGAQAIKLGLRICVLFIMARLLTPQDFGVFAMTVTFTGFLEMFNSINLMTPTVQKAQITHQQISFLFWVSAALGAALTLITAASGPLIARFYGDPRLAGVALGLAPMFLFRGLARQHQALLQRGMRLGAIEKSKVAAQLLGATAMIASAWYGAGYWSLVLNIVVMSAAEAAFFWSLAGWRPGLPRRGSGVRKMLEFGGNLSAYEVFCYVQGSLDQILIGHSWGAQSVGLYAKASGLITLSVTQLAGPIGYVVVPALSRLQSEKARYRVYYAKTLGATLFLTMALVAFISIDARQIVLTALGAKWLPVVPIFIALAPAAAAATLQIAYTWVCLSLGHGERLSRAALCTAAVCSAAFLIGLHWGPVGVARAYSVALCALIIPLLSYGLADSPITPLDVWGIAWRPAAASAAAAVTTLAVQPFLVHARLPAVQFAGDAALFGTFYAAMWLVLPGGKEFLRELSSSALRSIR